MPRNPRFLPASKVTLTAPNKHEQTEKSPVNQRLTGLVTKCNGAQEGTRTPTELPAST